MASETSITTVNRYTNVIVLAGIILLWLIGLFHLFNQQVGQGVGLIVTALVLLRVFVWLEKQKLTNARKSYN